MSKTIYIIFKAGILSGALFFLSIHLNAQDSLSTHTRSLSSDSLLIQKKSRSGVSARHDTSVTARQDSSARPMEPDIRSNEKMKKRWTPDPERATILSAVLPGLGQIYNRKYWKVPIIYATAGVIYYFYYINDTAFNSSRRLYEEELSKGSYADDALLQEYKLDYENYNKKREYKLILLGVLYVANVVDAMADAYFATYDISDELAFKIRPTLSPIPDYASINMTYGIKMSFYF